MLKSYTWIFLMLWFCNWAGAQPYPIGTRAAAIDSNVVFVENRGQWPGTFQYKSELSRGAVFFTKTGYRVALIDPKFDMHEYKHQSGSKTMGAPVKSPPAKLDAIAYDMHLLGANEQVKIVSGHQRKDYRNYFLGNDPSKWVAEVPTNLNISYPNIYPQIHLHYYGFEDQIKYDFEVHVGGNPEKIQWVYKGLKNPPVLEKGHLKIQTELGEIKELAPVAWQIINDKQKFVKIAFQLQGEIVSFKLGKFDAGYPLIIDPTIVFSSFSGGGSDNWGFTATHDNLGHLYAGGIVFGTSYPTTPGAYQINFNFNGPQDLTVGYYSDVAITKFTPNGNALAYSTFFGGLASEQPHSMVVNSNNELIVYGITASLNHPVSPGAFQTTHGGGQYFVENAVIFANGVDIFLARFSTNGNALLASTLIGGSGNDGFNSALKFNYGDGARGEVQVDSSGNVYVISSTNSTNFPTAGGPSALQGAQSAVVFRMNANFSNLNWAEYFGGAGLDAGYSLDLDRVGNLYITGGTTSAQLPATAQSYMAAPGGGPADGYLARLNANTGAIFRTTFLGTNAYDQSFFVKTDRFNDVYVFGQTKGNYLVTPGTFSTPNGGQFVQKLNPALNTTLFSTVFGGSGPQRTNIAPTAFAVDRCQNIMLSGWGGSSNNTNMGTTSGLPVTNDAFQSTTDGSDLYFMVLERNAAAVKFASFYGGTAREHVDGGTSRFDPEGRIYQVVCAGCAGMSFPTTPGVAGPNNGSTNCNIAGIKIDFNLGIQAVADVEFNIDIDSICGGAFVTFDNTSVNANAFFWDFGNGQTSTQQNPAVVYRDTGTYVIMLIAFDTICDLSDTTYLTFENDFFREVTADFTADFRSCDGSGTVLLTNLSRDANQYFWDFGDGNSSTLFQPRYAFAGPGIYTITLIVRDSICDLWDTTRTEVVFEVDDFRPEVTVRGSDCLNGTIEFDLSNMESHYIYEWFFYGVVETGAQPQYVFRSTDVHRFTLTIIDTLCNRKFVYDLDVDVIYEPDRLFIPNAFTPNQDGINELLIIGGNQCIDDPRFVILSRWGELVFETDKPFEVFWDGKHNGKTVGTDVFVYRFYTARKSWTGTITVLR